MPLRLVSFNVRCGHAPDGLDAWAFRRPRAAAFLRELDFDLAGLQEPLAFQLDDLLADLPGYAALGVGRDDGDREGEFAAILYRENRLRALSSGTFWLSDTPETPGSITWGNDCVRVCTWARFEDRMAGGRFVHFNTHLDHKSQPSRERSVELILRRMRAEPGPTLLSGDFNADEDNPAICYLIEHGLFDTFRVLHPDVRDVGTYSGFADSYDPEKIDYVFATPGIEVLESEIVKRQIGGRWPSDHAALRVVLAHDWNRASAGLS